MPELDLGNVKGPQGKSAYQSALDAGYSGSEEAFNTAMAKAPDAVLYTAQSLSDAQKEQARGNINAAPGGFGLGGAAKMLTASDNVDNVMKNGWYTWSWKPTEQPAGLPDEAKYHTGLMRVDSVDDTATTAQTIYFLLSNVANVGDQCVIQRMGIISNVWNPFEWVNPPMNLGVEYRTTERYLGKPVYVKKVSFGNAPASSIKTVDCGVTNVDKVVDFNLIVWNGGFGQKNIIYDDSGKLLARPYVVISEGSLKIALAVFEDISTRPVDCFVKYTKTTD